jgi:hypothetical protein
MARLAFVAADPDPSRLLQHVEGAAEARHHEVVSVPAGSASATGSLASFDLFVYEISNDEGSLPVYRLAVDTPGAVVLVDRRIDRVLDALVEVDRAEAELAVREGAIGFAARHPAGEPDEAAFSLRLARRALAVTVGTEAARASLEGLGCRTPIFAGEGAIGTAIDAALARAESPVRQALARWGSALAAVGVRPGEVDRGLGARYADAVETLTNPAGPVLPRS